jgi:hypothetical protein
MGISNLKNNLTIGSLPNFKIDTFPQDNKYSEITKSINWISADNWTGDHVLVWEPQPGKAIVLLELTVYYYRMSTSANDLFGIYLYKNINLLNADDDLKIIAHTKMHDNIVRFSFGDGLKFSATEKITARHRSSGNAHTASFSVIARGYEM